MKKLLLLILLFPALGFSQTQIGQDIDGVTTFSLFGPNLALSSDGATVATSAIFNDVIASNAGLAQAFRFGSGTWNQLGQDIYGQNVNNFVGAVAFDNNGDIMAIGAAGNNSNGGGYAQVYENIAGTWTQIGVDIMNESIIESSSSLSLSSDGNIIAIGASDNFNNGQSSGHVRVYENNLGAWTQIGSDIDGEGQFDKFGSDVQLSSNGSILAVGGFQNNENGSNSGHVRVFENVGGTWMQIGSDIDGEVAEDNFGFSISLSSDGTILAVGAPNVSDNGPNPGYAKIFENVGGTWIQIGSNINGENAEDNFGVSVSLSSNGNILAIGGTGNDGGGVNSGHLRIYLNIAGTWTQLGSDIVGEAAGDEFGNSVLLSSNGEILAAGARYNDGGGNSSGHVRVYDLSLLLSSDEFVLSQFSIFPNPAKDNITIELQEGIELENINIYNNLGQFISSTNNLQVNTSQLSSGLYFVEVATNKGKTTKKVVIE